MQTEVNSVRRFNSPCSAFPPSVDGNPVLSDGNSVMADGSGALSTLAFFNCACKYHNVIININVDTERDRTIQ